MTGEREGEARGVESDRSTRRVVWPPVPVECARYPCHCLANRRINSKTPLRCPFPRADYYGKLSAQLAWQRNPERPVRVVYGGWGAPTAALLHDDHAIVDYKLFWTTCKDTQEANYLLSIINSDALYEMVTPLMSKGQFGARDLQKHLWKLPIPEFDSDAPLHAAVSEAGEAAAEGAAQQLVLLRQQRDRVTVTIARRELRKWLRQAPEGQAVEDAVGRLLNANDE